MRQSTEIKEMIATMFQFNDVRQPAGLNALLTSIAVGILFLPGCGQRNQFIPPPPPKVTVAKVTQKPVADYIDFTGTTRATATVELRARVRGYLEKIAFTDGSNVKKGDLLFVIEQAPLKVALDQARAEAKKAEAALQLATAEFERATELWQRKAISKADYDARSAEHGSAVASVDATKAAVDQAQLNYNYSEIRAPIDGRIGRHLVDLGNLVDAEMTPLAKIESIDPIYAHFNVSERDLLRLMSMRRENQLPDPDKYPPEVRLGLANEKGFPHIGKLDYRELGIDPKTGTALRRIILPNADGLLIPGMFVRLRAQLGNPTPRLVVPDVAIATDQRGDYVLAVNDKNIVEYRPVKLGISDGGLRVIEEGVSLADRVIINGLQRARPNAPVDPEEATPPVSVVESGSDGPTTATGSGSNTATVPTTGHVAAASEETIPPARSASAKND